MTLGSGRSKRGSGARSGGGELGTVQQPRTQRHDRQPRVRGDALGHRRRPTQQHGRRRARLTAGVSGPSGPTQAEHQERRDLPGVTRSAPAASSASRGSCGSPSPGSCGHSASPRQSAPSSAPSSCVSPHSRLQADCCGSSCRACLRSSGWRSTYSHWLPCCCSSVWRWEAPAPTADAVGNGPASRGRTRQGSTPWVHRGDGAAPATLGHETGAAARPSGRASGRFASAGIVSIGSPLAASSRPMKLKSPTSAVAS